MITLSSSTRIVVQVAIEDDSGQVAAFLGGLTLLGQAGALALLLGCLLGLVRFLAGLAGWVSDFLEAARFTLTVFTIGFRSLAFGVGVKV